MAVSVGLGVYAHKLFLVLILAVVAVNGKATSGSKPSLASDSEVEILKEERQFDLNRDNYDPYEAQASAVAFRRFKEAQALKEGQILNSHDDSAAPHAPSVSVPASDNDKLYEKKFYDPFFYFNGQSNGHGQNPNPNSYANSNSNSRRNGRFAHYQLQSQSQAYPQFRPMPQYSMETGVPLRTRRNTGTTASTISDGIDNNLLNEDIYFFRRDSSAAGRQKQRLAEFEKSPYYFRESTRTQIQPEERQFPVSRTAAKEYQNYNYNLSPAVARQNVHPNDLYFSRLEQSPMHQRFNNFGARPRPAAAVAYQQYHPQPHAHSHFGLGLGSTHSPIDYNTVDGPRIRERERDPFQSIPRQLGGGGSEPAGVPASGLPGVNGWAVQVGTQLRVHDDGRTRHPHRYYVKDEKPRPIGRYPYYSDRDSVRNRQ